MIVADASAVIQACLSEADLEELRAHDLVAPPLLWSEATSAIHELKWRREISTELASRAVQRLRQAPVQARRWTDLHAEACRIADRLGWAKTYDAEYVALARHSRCRLLTTDARLAAVAGSLVEVIGPADL